MLIIKNEEEDMSGQIDAKIKELGLELPAPAQPAGSYVQFYISGNIIYISGQIPFWSGEARWQGKVGQDYSIEEGQEAAKICALNIIAQAKAALDGDLDRVKQIIKLGGFVNATPDFDMHPKVINGASDLMAAVFGEKGKHTRFAMGAGSLPLGVAVEIDAMIEFE
jgi:enamine deaminase RidA (YjgF/YER057c/UK114 family)